MIRIAILEDNPVDMELLKSLLLEPLHIVVYAVELSGNVDALRAVW